MATNFKAPYFNKPSMNADALINEMAQALVEGVHITPIYIENAVNKAVIEELNTEV